MTDRPHPSDNPTTTVDRIDARAAGARVEQIVHVWLDRPGQRRAGVLVDESPKRTLRFAPEAIFVIQNRGLEVIEFGKPTLHIDHVLRVEIATAV